MDSYSHYSELSISICILIVQGLEDQNLRISGILELSPLIL